ncbi:hypothetical protein [Chitinilyticum piscinae]|uniref:Uncharacterized protein n=1 Tax=Chitinilyticum piscinae TaxID=2866724 RepID=A0A8J7FL47_9NEIS|nr:hypothetical protein [Chitinilyticum piscinae]MBE9609807.1 hypothetical protein [Chitinilyticum piscinae]
MLDRLSSLFAKEKTPLASLKALHPWLKKIELLDPSSRCGKVHDVVSDFLVTSGATSKDALDALMELDDFAQEAYEALCYQYISNPRMPKELEQKLWKEIVHYARDMAEIYQRFIQADFGEALSAQLEPVMPVIWARSLHYLGIEAKWHYFRFEKAPTKLWTLAHQLYRLSEISGADSNPFKLYQTTSVHVTSCADEYLQLLLLNSVANNNLTVRQLHTVDLWLEQWSKLLQLARKYQADVHHLCVNLQDPSGLQKISATEGVETLRYLSLHELTHGVAEIIQKLEAGTSPASLGLGPDARGPGTLELLKHLEVFWTMHMRNSQIQRSERVKVSKSADVLYGLDKVCRHVRADNEKYSRQPAETKSQVDYDEIMDMRLYGFVSTRTRNRPASGMAAAAAPQTLQSKLPEWSTWLVENESDGGFGAHLRLSECEWIRPGLLLGVRFDTDANWQIGIVRRLQRTSDDEVYAGVQRLSSTPVAVSLYSDTLDRLEHITVDEIGYTGHIDLKNVRTAMYIPHQIDGANVNTLLMHSADYAAERIYKVQARDKVFSVSLGSLLEKGTDWIWVSVNVLRQES